MELFTNCLIGFRVRGVAPFVYEHQRDNYDFIRMEDDEKGAQIFVTLKCLYKKIYCWCPRYSALPQHTDYEKKSNDSATRDGQRLTIALKKKYSTKSMS